LIAGCHIEQAAASYRGLNTAGALIEAADRRAFAGARGQEVVAQCGRLVAERTVVVQLLFPKELPRASLSQGTVFASRFDDGFQLWEVAH
jgi:hypothetical protein